MHAPASNCDEMQKMRPVFCMHATAPAVTQTQVIKCICQKFIDVVPPRSPPLLNQFQVIFLPDFISVKILPNQEGRRYYRR